MSSLEQAVGYFGWQSVLVDLLVVARLVRLAQRDHPPILGPARARAVARGIDPHQPGQVPQLWTCSWCLSCWVALVVVAGHVAVAWAWGHVGVLVWIACGLPLALSYVAGWLAAREDR